MEQVGALKMNNNGKRGSCYMGIQLNKDILFEILCFGTKYDNSRKLRKARKRLKMLIISNKHSPTHFVQLVFDYRCE